MLLERGHRAGVDVARGTELEGDALIADVRREWAELHDGGRARGAGVRDRHVLDEPHTVSDAMRTAVLQRLPDRPRPKGFARVDGDREVFAAAELERIEMGFWRMAGLLTGDVEADHALLAVGDRELGHLERVGAIAHCADDLAQRDRMARFGAFEATHDGRDNLLEIQTTLRAEDRRITDLRVHDPIARQILAAFVSDALDRLDGLHDRDRVREAAKVERLRSAGRARMEPSCELARISGGQALVLLVTRELDDRVRTQPAVEMVVKQHLRRGTERLEGQHRGE